MNADETFTHCGVTVEIHQDINPESPSAHADTSLFLVAGHRDFYVPEPGEKRVSDWETLVATYKDSHWIFRIEAYIHSGVRLAFSNEGTFPDRRWDVSQVGAIFASKKEWRLSKSARKASECLLNTWNQYLAGDVWGYIVDKDGLNEDSCWGFYGLEYCKASAREVAEHAAAEKERERLEVERAACSDILTV